MAMQMWLITDYHDKGSLFDFLNRESVDRQLMLRLCLSAVTGLAHLHQDIVGNNSKSCTLVAVCVVVSNVCSLV